MTILISFYRARHVFSVQMYLTRLGYEVLKIRRRECDRIRDELTLTTDVSPASPTPGVRFPAYKEFPDRLVAPAQWGLEAFGVPPVDLRDENVCEIDENRAAFKGDLREAQKGPVDAVMRHLSSNGACTLILPTGAGKTACGLFVVSKLRVKTIVLVNKKILADQWRARIHQFLPNTRVTKVAGTTTDFSGDIVIASIQTLVSRKYDADTFREFGFHIFDEANHAAARVFGSVLYGLSTKFMLALTATPQRKDGLERLIYDFFGPPVRMETRDESRDPASVHLVKYSRMMYSNPPPKNRFGTLDFTRMVAVITDDTERTQMIADLVLKFPAERQVLVLSHRRQHCEDIASRLLVGGADAITYLGGAKAKQVPSNRILVSTYALAGEGFDCVRLDTLVLATPASDVVQAVGRVLRGAPDPRIYDIVDMWSVFIAQSTKRRKQYGELKMRVQNHASSATFHPDM
jgi:superfamily II DNA or RNA helicase